MIDGKRVVTTIEARMTSTRLPGKILMPLAGKPVLAQIIERHRRSNFADEIVVATTTNATDDPVVALCEDLRCPYFRGSEDDVLARIVGAGEIHGADILVQGYGDDPCVDPQYVDHVVKMLVEGGYDCAVSNDVSETFPIGLGVCAYSFPVLKCAEQIDTDSTYREHAGYSIRSQPKKFKVITWEAGSDMFWPELRLTLDTSEDYRLISAIYHELYPKNKAFSGADVVAFLRGRPDLAAVNSIIKQKKPSVSS